MRSQKPATGHKQTCIYFDQFRNRARSIRRRARAAENQVFVAYANRIGEEDHLHFVGQSCIIGPDGGVLARAEEGSEKLLVADIEADAIARARETACYLDELARDTTR